MPPTENTTPLPPSVEAAYYRKCIELKRRLNEIEANNDAARLRKLRVDRSIMKLRLERAFLLERLAERMAPNVDESDRSTSPPPTPQEKPTRSKRGHRQKTPNLDSQHGSNAPSHHSPHNPNNSHSHLHNVQTMSAASTPEPRHGGSQSGMFSSFGPGHPSMPTPMNGAATPSTPFGSTTGQPLRPLSAASHGGPLPQPQFVEERRSVENGSTASAEYGRSYGGSGTGDKMGSGSDANGERRSMQDTEMGEAGHSQEGSQPPAGFSGGFTAVNR
ncbi:uncharacterized protein IWZ02DRAFT_454765 [Phyllosticta citriasiana]|uniref:INO80 complex subunit F domain-containing protein n=1 Tax=Phyllosticta citriasiana TaxID=595635 RepID=A0ABR1KN27_9PEZI